MPCPDTFDQTSPPPVEWCRAGPPGLKVQRSSKPCGGYYEVSVPSGKDTPFRYYYDQSTRKLVGIIREPFHRCAGFVPSGPPAAADECVVLDQTLCDSGDAGIDAASD